MRTVSILYWSFNKKLYILYMKKILALPYYEEVWKDIPEYDGLYQGSNFFKVRSLNHYGKSKNDSVHFVNGKTLNLTKDKSTGYLIVRLCKNGVVKKHFVHRIMAELFIPNPDNLPTVDHINRIRDDRKISNLRWASYQTQQQNIIRKKKSPKKKIVVNKQNINGKPVIQLSTDGRFVAEYPSVKEAERQTGICFVSISNCCLGYKYRHTAGGYQWRYK